MTRLTPLLIILFLAATACSPQQRPQEQGNYQETKAMVMDIVGSDQFKEQLAKTMKDPDFQSMAAVKDPEFKRVMIEVFKDPEFKATLVDQIRDTEFKNELKKVIKDILREPDMKSLMQPSGGGGQGGGGQGGGGQGDGGGGGGGQ